jgi:hypothetical protein
LTRALVLVILRACGAAIPGALALTACRAHGESDEAVRAEAGRAAHAVKELRMAPNGQKAPLLSALKNVACTASDVCALKNSCAAAYSLELGALDGLHAVRRATENEAAPVPSSATDVLSRAETDLSRAVADEKACADSEAELERKYSL